MPQFVPMLFRQMHILWTRKQSISLKDPCVHSDYSQVLPEYARVPFLKKRNASLLILRREESDVVPSYFPMDKVLHTQAVCRIEGLRAPRLSNQK